MSKSITPMLAQGPTWLEASMLLVGEFVASIGVMVFDVQTQNSLIARPVPNQMRSRVAGVMRFFNDGVRPIGALLGGLLGGGSDRGRRCGSASSARCSACCSCSPRRHRGLREEDDRGARH